MTSNVLLTILIGSWCFFKEKAYPAINFKSVTNTADEQSFPQNCKNLSTQTHPGTIF